METTFNATDYHSSNTHNSSFTSRFFIIRYVQDIHKNFCNGIQEKKATQRHPDCMTDADYNYILDEIERREKIEFERNVIVNSYKE